MATLIDCIDFTCGEALIETTIAGTGAVAFVLGFKIISKDRNNLLTRINKIIYGMGMVQMVFLFLYFFFWGSDLIISTIRALRLVTEAMICSVLSEIVLEEGYYKLIQKVLKIVFAFVFIEWFWTALINQSIYDYFCLSMDYILLSATTVIFSLISAYLGMTALQLIKSIQEDNAPFEKPRQIESIYDEVTSQQFQIKLLIGANCSSAFIQFIWDYVAYTQAYTIEDCVQYYEAQSLIGIFVVSGLKFITLMASPLTIYFVFYYVQKNQFNTSTAKEMSPSIFFDRRSELIKNFNAQEMITYN